MIASATNILVPIMYSLIMPPYLYFKPRQVNNVPVRQGPLILKLFWVKYVFFFNFN